MVIFLSGHVGIDLKPVILDALVGLVYFTEYL